MKKSFFSIFFVSLFAGLFAAEIPLTESQFIREKNTTHSVKDGVITLSMNGSGVYTPVSFRLNQPADPELICKFQYRVIRNGAPIDYVGINFFQGKKTVMTRVPNSEEWRSAAVPLKDLKLVPGENLTKLTIFARCGGGGMPTLELQNVRLVSGADAAKPEPEIRQTAAPAADDMIIKPNQFMPAGGTTHSVADGVVSVTMDTPSVYTTVNYRMNLSARPELVCKFDYRVKANGAQVDYVGVTFYSGKKSFFVSVPSPSEWEWCPGKVSLGNLKIPAGTKLDKLSIFAKVSKSGKPTIEIRNIRFEENPEYNAAKNLRISYSAYPMFDWWKATGAEKYRLQYGNDTVETTENFYIPTTPVAPGVVEYTVTALPANKVIYQEKIRIPERNTKWLLPEYDWQTFAKLPHPRFKALSIQQAGDKVEKLMELARKHALVPVPDPPKPYVPGADPNIRSRIEWFGKVSGAITAGTGERMTVLGQMAVYSGDADLIRAAREQALAVAKWNPNGTTHMRHADLYAARLLRGLTWCYDAAYQIMTPDERAQVVKAVQARADQFYFNACPFRLNEVQNHSWERMEIAVFAALALAEMPGMEERFRFGAGVYAYRIFPALGYEGENNEGLMYWAYGLGMALRFVDVARHTVGVDLYGQPWLQQTSRFPMYINPPQSYSISFADTGAPNHCSIGPMSRHFTGKLAGAGRDPYSLWYCGYPEMNGITARVPLEIPQSRLYGHIGYTLLNTFLPDGREGVSVGFHSGRYFAGHQHADQNHFVINAYGDKLAIDGGYYDWWGSRHFAAYSAKTVAHNTILVDGKGQDWIKDGSDGVTRLYFDSQNFGFVSGDAAKVYQDRVKQFDRDLLFVKPGLVFVYDRLQAAKPAVFSWLLHSHSEENIAVKGQSFAFSRPLAALTGNILLPRDAAMKADRAYTVMPVKGYSETPVDNPQKEWCLTVANPAAAEKMEFLAAMRILRGGTAAVPEAVGRMEENTDALLIRAKDVEVLFNRTPGKPVQLGRFTTDARCAAVILKEGAVADMMKIGGKVFSYGDFRCDQSGDFAKIRRSLTSQDGVMTVAGKPVPVKQHQVDFVTGEKIFMVEGIVQIPEDGEYQLICKTAGNYIVSQGKGMRQAGVCQSGEAVKMDMAKGPAIISVTHNAPIGEIALQAAPAGM